jgi:hypothetical protein
MANSDINGRLSFAILGKESRVSREQESQALLMPVLSAEMRRGVSVYILRIRIGTRHQQRLYHCEISSDTGNVKRGSEVLCPSIYHCPILYQDLYESSMAFRGTDMDGSPTVAIGAVNAGLRLIRYLLLKDFESC